MQRKAQGLPINTIILIAIGLLILVIVVLFVTKGFGGLGSAVSPSSAMSASAFASQCNTYCSNAQSTNSVPNAYCTLGDTVTTASGKSEFVNCYNVSVLTGGAQTGCTLNNGTTFYPNKGLTGCTSQLSNAAP